MRLALGLITTFPLLKVGLLSCGIYAGLVFAAAIAWAIAVLRSGGLGLEVSRPGVYVILGAFWFLSTTVSLLILSRH